MLLAAKVFRRDDTETFTISSHHFPFRHFPSLDGCLGPQIGGTARQKNAITSGAYVVESPEVLSLDGDGMEISVGIRTRSFFGQVIGFSERLANGGGGGGQPCQVLSLSVRRW